MSAAHSFSALLAKYLSADLLKEEFFKQHSLLSALGKHEYWLGAPIPLPPDSPSCPKCGAPPETVAWGKICRPCGVTLCPLPHVGADPETQTT